MAARRSAHRSSATHPRLRHRVDDINHPSSLLVVAVVSKNNQPRASCRQMTDRLRSHTHRIQLPRRCNCSRCVCVCVRVWMVCGWCAWCACGSVAQPRISCATGQWRCIAGFWQAFFHTPTRFVVDGAVHRGWKFTMAHTHAPHPNRVKDSCVASHPEIKRRGVGLGFQVDALPRTKGLVWVRAFPVPSLRLAGRRCTPPSYLEPPSGRRRRRGASFFVSFVLLRGVAEFFFASA